MLVDFGVVVEEVTFIEPCDRSAVVITMDLKELSVGTVDTEIFLPVVMGVSDDAGEADVGSDGPDEAIPEGTLPDSTEDMLETEEADLEGFVVEDIIEL